MDRKPVVAGQFYPGSKQEWEGKVREYLLSETRGDTIQAKLVMLPHAGHIFSGHVAGATLAKVNLPSSVLLLGPNHTGQGEAVAVWPDGNWLLPDAHLEVDADLARAIIESDPTLAADDQAHRSEHSLEVLLPFLWARDPQTKIVPVCISLPDKDKLDRLAENIAHVLKAWHSDVGLVVSSDMSHFLPEDEAKAQDDMALQAILDLDPDKLLEVVARHRISMCGILPMFVGLKIASALGAKQAELVRYATSGDVIGDRSHVVGYAGVIVS
ncbi:MAG: AmmeMemoRadiSam system protein B [Desulfovermiculus sp.]|nr:AmmeMemoRadiSam system protein B [Desulfovermiculus sp.]